MQAIIDTFQTSSLLRILVIIVLLFVVQFIVQHFSYTIIRRLVRSNGYSSKQAEVQREDTLTSVVNKTTGTIVWIIGICLILSQLHFNWAGLLAGAGVLGLVIGFGAQKVFGDFLAGFFILLENQYSIGDIVEVQGMAYGTVEAIHLRTTHIRNLDGGLHIIANSEIVNMANHSYGQATAVIYQWLHYDTDVDTVKQIVDAVGSDLAADAEWSKQTISPIAFDRVEDYGADGLKIRATGNTAPGMQWAVAGEFRQRLKTEFDKAGIHPAYPHRVVLSPEPKGKKSK